MIDRYEIRRIVDSARYRLSSLPRRTLVLGSIAALLIPALIAAAVVMSSGGTSATAEKDRQFRELSRRELTSADGKADTARLTQLSDADLAKELQKRHDAVNGLERAGQAKSPAGEKAFGELLRVTQVNAERQRKKPKLGD